MRPQRLQRVLAAFANTAWAITPEKLREIAEVVGRRARGERLSRAEITARLGALQERRQEAVAPPRRIAIVRVHGSIMPRISGMEDTSGGTSCEAIARAVRSAAADPEVAAILLDIDSPGGACQGMLELEAVLREAAARKRLVALAHHDACSLACWIACCAAEFCATPSAQVGSIGVLSVHYDDTGALAKEGFARTVITSAPNKAEFLGPLSPSARARLEALVREWDERFVGAVARGRRVSAETVRATFGAGRALTAEEALAAGLIDRICTYEVLLAELAASAAPAAGASVSARPAAAHNPEGTSIMDPRLRAALLAANLIAAQASDEAAAAVLQGWCAARGLDPAAGVDTLIGAIAVHHLVSAAAPPAAGTTAPPPPAPPPGTTAAPPAAPPPAAAGDRAGVDHVVAVLRLATSLEPAARLALQEELVALAQAGALTHAELTRRVSERLAAANPPAGPTLLAGTAERDRLVETARDALLLRVWGGTPPQQITTAQGDQVVWNPQAARQARHLQSLPRLAEALLRSAGVPETVLGRLSGPQIARIVTHGAGGIVASEAAYQTRSLFANIFYDAANVMLRRSYREARTTYNVWARQGESANDFKAIHRIMASAFSTPSAIPENGRFTEATMGDGRESYSLTVWGAIFTLSFEMIVDDQLGAFANLSTKAGASLQRKWNALVYQILKDNAALQTDGVALFHASHANTTTTGGAPSVATLNTLTRKMREQTDPKGATLNVSPRYLLVPPALEGTALTLVQSTADPASSNAGVKNIWQQRVDVVSDAELGAASSGGSDAAYYVAADAREIDTVEYAFLAGYEEPVIEQMPLFESLGIGLRWFQAFGAKAIDYRGLQHHSGGA